MDPKIKIDLDKLPIKRLEAIEESGIEHFSSEVTNEESRLNLVRRIDFSSIIEKDAKKQKTSKETTAPTFQWQSLVENLRQAHQELNVVIDLINTVETNDAVTVASMQRPKQLPNEWLSDLSVSAATKLQRLRHLGKYFKESSKALEQQVIREARFYGSLIRLQQNWKVKRQRAGLIGPGSENFMIDLQDNLTNDIIYSRPSFSSAVRIDEDSRGILAVQRPLKSCHYLCLNFIGANPSHKPRTFIRNKKHAGSPENLSVVKKESVTDEDVDECVKDTHSTLREIHQSIFQEHVFYMVNRETHSTSPGVIVTGTEEDHLQLAIGQEISISLSLVPSGNDDRSQTKTSIDGIQNENNEDVYPKPSYQTLKVSSEVPFSTSSFEIYLQQLFHESLFVKKAKDMQSHVPIHVPGVSLSHFCLTIAHRFVSKKVLLELENLVAKVPFLHLLSQPTWNSRTSSWFISLKVPRSIFQSGKQSKSSDNVGAKTMARSQFQTKVAVNDDRISVSAESAPNITSSFSSNTTGFCRINSYGCDLDDLPMTLLQQVASQVILWLHEEALVVGMNATRDFLCQKFNLDRGETLCLVPHLDPHDAQGCISWWLMVENGPTDNGKLPYQNKDKMFLGHLSLEELHSIVMDLVGLCSTGSGR